MLLLSQVVKPASLVSDDVDVIDFRHGLYLSEDFVLPDVCHFAEMNFDTLDGVELLVQYVLNLMNTAESSFAQLLKEFKAVRMTVQQQLVDGTLDRYVRRNFIVRQFGDRLLPLLTGVMGHSSSREAGAVDALSSFCKQR